MTAHSLNHCLKNGVRYSQVREAYPLIVNTLCREYGLFKLPGAKDYGDRDYINELANFFLREQDIERARSDKTGHWNLMISLS